MFRRIFALFNKDLRRELESGEIVSTTILFSVVLVVISAFAFFNGETSPRTLFPGVLWLSIFFSGTLVVNQTLRYETENNCIEALVMIPEASESIYFGKCLVNLVLLLLFELVFIPILLITFNVSFLEAPFLYLFALIGVSVGYAALGTIVSSILVAARLRNILLPLILFPLAVPLFIAGVQVVNGAMMERTLRHLADWAGVIVAIDGIVLFGGAILYRWVVKGMN